MPRFSFVPDVVLEHRQAAFTQSRYRAVPLRVWSFSEVPTPNIWIRTIWITSKHRLIILRENEMRVRTYGHQHPEYSSDLHCLRRISFYVSEREESEEDDREVGPSCRLAESNFHLEILEHLYKARTGHSQMTTYQLQCCTQLPKWLMEHDSICFVCRCRQFDWNSSCFLNLSAWSHFCSIASAWCFTVWCHSG